VALGPPHQEAVELRAGSQLLEQICIPEQ
jgi:hypothetical protein